MPDYAIHDERYKLRRRNPEFVGWERPSDYAQGMAQLEEFLDLGIAPRQGRLLELGCGAGNYSCFFAKKGFDVTGIDISQTALDWAHENSARAGVSATFLREDVVSLASIDNSAFDFVFDGHLLHCIIGGDRSELLHNVLRVLRPDGYFMVRHVVGPVASTRELVVDKMTNVAYLNGHTPYRFYPDAHELLDELVNAGFRVLHWDYTLTLDDGYGFQHVTIQCGRA